MGEQVCIKGRYTACVRALVVHLSASLEHFPPEHRTALKAPGRDPTAFTQDGRTHCSQA